MGSGFLTRNRTQAPCLGSAVLATVAAAAAKSLQSCPTLCDPIDSSPPGFPIPGILQARMLEWVAISFSRGSSQSRDRTQVSRIADRHFTVLNMSLDGCSMLYLVAQSCPTLCDPMDCSPPGSSVHGDFPGKNIGVGFHALLQGIFPI